MEYRKITSSEQALLQRLLSFRSNDKEEAAHNKEQLVAVIDNEGSLKFVYDNQLEQFEQQKFPIEAQHLDADGVYIHALLFFANGQINELEIYKDDSSPIIRMPKPEDWEVIELQ